MEKGVYMVLKRVEVIQQKKVVVDNKEVLGSNTNTEETTTSVFVTSQPDNQIICKLLMYKLIMFVTDLI